MAEPIYMYRYWVVPPKGEKYLTDKHYTPEQAKKEFPVCYPDYDTRIQGGGLMQGGGLYPDWGKKK